MRCPRMAHSSRSCVTALFVLTAASAARVIGAQSAPTDTGRVSRGNSARSATFSRVSGDVLLNAPAFTLEQTLQGKVAGMVVSMNSGAPWSDGQIQLRGVSTLVGDPSPLVIVDGVRITNTLLGDPTAGLARDTARAMRSTARLRDFTPFEIELVEVLKGPAATALYGSRGAGGVLLITTRRGGEGPLRWRAMQRAGAAENTRVAGPRCFGDVETARRDSRFFGGGAQAAATANGGQLPCYARVRDLFSSVGVGVESAAAASGTLFGTRVLLSAARLSNGGPIDGTGASRSNLRMNVDRAITSRLSARLSTGVALTAADRGYLTDRATYRYATFPSWLSDTAIQSAGGFDPRTWQRSGTETESGTRWTSSLGVDYSAVQRPATALTVSYVGGVDRLALRDRLRFEVRDTLSYDVTGNTDDNSAMDNHELAANLRQRVGTDAQLDVSLAATWDKQEMRHERNVTYGPFQSSSVNARNSLRTSAVQLRSSASLLGDRLQIGAAARRESIRGAARLNAAVYPALSAAYHMRRADTSGGGLTMRAAWGRSGGLGALGTAPLATRFSTDLFDPNAPLSSDLIERRTDTEIGVDVRARRGRVMASGTVFRSVHDALYLSVPIAGAGFFGVYQPNLVAMRTRGAELTLSARLLESTRLNWESRVNVTASTTDITRPANDSAIIDLAYTAHGFRRHRVIGGARATAIASFTGRPKGNGAPQFDLSAINTVSRGPLALVLQLDWRAGTQVYSQLLTRSDQQGTSTDYARPSPGSPAELGAYRRGRANFSDTLGVYVSPGGSLRIRELSIRYALSPRWAAQAFASQNVGVSVQARNLAMWTSSVAADPEFSGLGTNPVARYVDFGGYPPMRQVFFGIDAGF